ncbi:MAG: GTPase Era [Candidatus Muproteobacteria bacterium RBG_16_60_9]|uniref:GTPase Era n=1 Tax=Candidatus Muproteobacteria bacterium RBG_16_60_9 TaxID=1817755 RepID=A0A1F6UY24_9PROT|nr:MAG: GTPase Era [Candidatus Muproteobacteria bacterium RBG_16_60_9]
MVALIGRPNVGKSTLLNRLVGEKISIVSRRPQTTRHRILGIKTTDVGQIVYVDTPGLHAAQGRRLNRYLARLASGSVEGVDCVVLMIAASGWTPEDEDALALVRARQIPVVLVINKVDEVHDRRKLLPLTRDSAARMEFADIVPLSARTAENVDRFERAVLALLPEQAAAFPADQVTDKSVRFRAHETVREQICHLYGQEIPHVTAVEVTRFKHSKKRLDIECVIWAEREGQKAILIGKGGERLKQVGMRVRRVLEERHGGKANVRLWVKVRDRWSDDARAMQRFGFHDEPM